MLRPLLSCVLALCAGLALAGCPGPSATPAVRIVSPAPDSSFSPPSTPDLKVELELENLACATPELSVRTTRTYPVAEGERSVTIPFAALVEQLQTTDAQTVALQAWASCPNEPPVTSEQVTLTIRDVAEQKALALPADSGRTWFLSPDPGGFTFHSNDHQVLGLLGPDFGARALLRTDSVPFTIPDAPAPALQGAGPSNGQRLPFVATRTASGTAAQFETVYGAVDTAGAIAWSFSHTTADPSPIVHDVTIDVGAGLLYSLSGSGTGVQAVRTDRTILWTKPLPGSFTGQNLRTQLRKGGGVELAWYNGAAVGFASFDAAGNPIAQKALDARADVLQLELLQPGVLVAVTSTALNLWRLPETTECTFPLAATPQELPSNERLLLQLSASGQAGAALYKTTEGATHHDRLLLWNLAGCASKDVADPFLPRGIELYSYLPALTVSEAGATWVVGAGHAFKLDAQGTLLRHVGDAYGLRSEAYPCGERLCVRNGELTVAVLEP